MNDIVKLSTTGVLTIKKARQNQLYAAFQWRWQSLLYGKMLHTMPSDIAPSCEVNWRIWDTQKEAIIRFRVASTGST